MKVIRIFSPGIFSEANSKLYVPVFFPFVKNKDNPKTKTEIFGEWINYFTLTDNIEECNMVVPPYFVDHYYKQNKKHILQQINAEAVRHHKLTVCFTSGDHGITPTLQNFHLYRNGGYASKNKSNQFVFPVFFPDPKEKFYNNNLQIHTTKSPKPVIGFCGQGNADLRKKYIDYSRNLLQRFSSMTGKSAGDPEPIISPVYIRSQILNVLESSSLVQTNFKRFTKYRAGAVNKEEKEKSSLLYFENMQQSEYILCYRGTGNFSVRLYETLASARIPIIIHSDNNMLHADKIDWNIFPNIQEKDSQSIDKAVADFHNKLSNESFTQLQLHARKIWEEYISYKGFMWHFIEKYSAK